MALSKDEVIKIATGFLESIRGRHDIKRAYLFGSFARGTMREYSDVDLAIVLGSLQGFSDSPFDEQFEIFHEAQEFNSLLEVVCFSQEEFEKDGGALVQQIKKEGLKLF